MRRVLFFLIIILHALIHLLAIIAFADWSFNRKVSREVRAHAMVLEWASQHKSELLNNWKKAAVPEKMDKIEPLK